mgnify:CR=1 FL=1
MTISDDYLRATANCWEFENLSYNHERKLWVHKRTIRILRHFAENVLGLNKNQYSVRSNQAGPAISGEVTLHTNSIGEHYHGIYVQISQSYGGVDMGVLYRACNNVADYTGKRNNHSAVSWWFADNTRMIQFGEEVKRICQIPAFLVV